MGALASHKDDINNIDNEHDHQFTAHHGLGRYSNTHTSTTRSAISKNLNVEELEMLLEAYFVQIDGTLNKLSTVCNLIFLLDSSTWVHWRHMTCSHIQMLMLSPSLEVQVIMLSPS